jgi:hypothetical protein
VFYRKWDSQLESLLQIAKTVFILLVLGVGALLFSADANRLVLIPVDRMVQRVKNMADNPRHKVRCGFPQCVSHFLRLLMGRKIIFLKWPSHLTLQAKMIK